MQLSANQKVEVGWTRCAHGASVGEISTRDDHVIPGPSSANTGSTHGGINANYIANLK